MNKDIYRKIKILILFLILAVTPFCRGCDYVIGFPVAVRIVIFNIIPEYKITPVQINNFMILLMIDIMIACVFAVSVIKNVHRFRWLPHFLNAAALNILINWIIFFSALRIFDNKLFFSLFVKTLANGLSYYALFIPVIIVNKSIPNLMACVRALEISIKLWFVVTTFLLTGLFCWLEVLKNKYFKKRQISSC